MLSISGHMLSVTELCPVGLDGILLSADPAARLWLSTDCIADWDGVRPYIALEIGASFLITAFTILYTVPIVSSIYPLPNAPTPAGHSQLPFHDVGCRTQWRKSVWFDRRGGGPCLCHWNSSIQTYSVLFYHSLLPAHSAFRIGN